jgi:ElaB/YqjD/DUF883 family membrane-anchored ribosome-binding protein
MTIREANQILVGDFNQVVSHAEQFLEATAGEAGEKVKELRSRLAASLESAKAAQERLQDTTARVARKTDRVIRRHPYESIGVVFGVGLLLGALRRRS